MKTYTKIIDGKRVCKTRNQIVLHIQKTIVDKDGNEKVVVLQSFNPSEESIIADGWEMVVEAEASEIDKAKSRLKARIMRYDTSEHVNAFYMQGQQMWLDKATRAGLMLRFQAEQNMGYDYTTLWHNGQMYEISLAGAFQMLYALEVYASACYDNTQRHLAEIQVLQTIEEIQNYNYTTGYPKQLEF